MPLVQLGLNPILIDCEIDTVNVSLEKIKMKGFDHKISLREGRIKMYSFFKQ
jgi:hypothetical protein